jgi:hypothetical protein
VSVPPVPPEGCDEIYLHRFNLSSDQRSDPTFTIDSFY